VGTTLVGFAVPSVGTVGEMAQEVMSSWPTPPPETISGSVCPDPVFCTPYSTKVQAVAVKNAIVPALTAYETAKFGLATAALWVSYMSRTYGDDLTPLELTDSKIIADFTKTLPTQIEQYRMASEAIQLIKDRKLCGDLPDGVWKRLDIQKLGVVKDRPKMDFFVVDSIAGNIAGGVGSCDGQLDSRAGKGFMYLQANTGGDMHVRTQFQFDVFDCIDFCPGQCGTSKEQLATVPMSRIEAMGGFYDQPFHVAYQGVVMDIIVNPDFVPGGCSDGSLDLAPGDEVPDAVVTVPGSTHKLPDKLQIDS